MKRSAAATLHRTVRRGLTWRPKSLGREEVDISRLISPLRYDVRVRADFYDFLEANEHLPEAALLEAARDQPYRVWFEQVAVPRFRPWAHSTPQLFDEHYDERVLRSLTMLRSFCDGGFDLRTPVTLRWVRGVPRTDSGVEVSARLHVGDGGHRLALLLRSGGVLHPKQFRVDPRTQPAVIDNTAILARALELPEATYARFISAGFTDQGFDTVAGLHFHLAKTDPSRVSELEQLLQAHGRTARLSV